MGVRSLKLWALISPERFIVDLYFNREKLNLFFFLLGTVIQTIRATDPDGDTLKFGIISDEGSDLLEVRPSTFPNEAQLVLKKQLDREVSLCLKKMLILTVK